MPIPQNVWDLLLANTQASGQSFNPWALGRAAQPQSGGTLDQAIAEARQRLAGPMSAAPPTPAAPMLQPDDQPSSAALLAGLGTNAPTADPATAASITGGRAGFPGGLVGSTAFNMGLGLLGATNPFTSLFTALPMIGNRIADFAVNRGLTAGPSPSSLDALGLTPDTYAGGPRGEQAMAALQTELGIAPRPGQPALSAAEPALGLSPAQVFGLTGFGGLGGPAGTGQLDSFTPQGAPRSIDNTNFGPRANDPTDAGPGPGPGPGAPGDPGSSPGDAPGAGGQAPYRGGYLSGPRTKKRKVPEAHGGEFVVNNAATRVYGPMLEELNASVQPDRDLDSLVDRARKFWD